LVQANLLTRIFGNVSFGIMQPCQSQLTPLRRVWTSSMAPLRSGYVFASLSLSSWSISVQGEKPTAKRFVLPKVHGCFAQPKVEGRPGTGTGMNALSLVATCFHNINKVLEIIKIPLGSSSSQKPIILYRLTWCTFDECRSLKRIGILILGEFWFWAPGVWFLKGFSIYLFRWCFHV
jgi:hypothetical protein